MLIIVGAIIVLGSTLGGLCLLEAIPWCSSIYLNLLLSWGLRWDCVIGSPPARIKRSDTHKTKAAMFGKVLGED